MQQVHQFLKTAVTCNVCQDVRSRVLQCSNAHSTCYECYQNLESGSCPECRVRGGWVRGRLVEELSDLVDAKYACVHRGCDARVPLSEVDSHRQSCVFRTFSCPLFPFGCTIMTREQLIPHLQLHSGVRTMTSADTLQCILKLRAPWRTVVICDGVVIVLTVGSPMTLGNPRMVLTSLHAGTLGNRGVVRACVTNTSGCRTKKTTQSFVLEEATDSGTPFACRLDVFPGTVGEDQVHLNGPLRGLRYVEDDFSEATPSVGLSLRFECEVEESE